MAPTIAITYEYFLYIFVSSIAIQHSQFDSIRFVYTQLNVSKIYYLTLIILFDINHLFAHT